MEENIISPALYLIPCGLSDAPWKQMVPDYNVEIMEGIRHYVVENIRTARRWIRKCCPDFSFENVEFIELNTHTSIEEVDAMLNPLRKGYPIGLLSEAGCPAIADPGSDLVAIAQKEGLKVIPLIGPSSILLGLMGSGFNGQSFCFHGYLPIDEREKIACLQKLEKESERDNRTQIFIETPYRNNKMMALMIENLHGDTKICVGCNITDISSESIVTKKVSEWKNTSYDYSKKPTIFLIFRGTGSRGGLIYSTKGRKKR